METSAVVLLLTKVKGELRAALQLPVGQTGILGIGLPLPSKWWGLYCESGSPALFFFPLMKNPATATPGFFPLAPGTGDWSQDSEKRESPETYSASNRLALPWSAIPEPAPFRRAHRILPRR